MDEEEVNPPPIALTTEIIILIRYQAIPIRWCFLALESQFVIFLYLFIIYINTCIVVKMELKVKSGRENYI